MADLLKDLQDVLWTAEYSRNKVEELRRENSGLREERDKLASLLAKATAISTRNTMLLGVALSGEEGRATARKMIEAEELKEAPKPKA